MKFPIIHFPSAEDAKRCLRLADPCGGRLYLSTYLNCAWLILRDNSLIWRGCEDEFFVTQDEFNKVRIIKYSDDRYVVKFPDEACYWDDRRFRGGPRYQVEDMAIDLSLHYHACQKVEEARAKEEPRTPKMDYWEREALLDDIYAATHPPIMPIPVYGSIYGGTDWFFEE